MPNFGLPKFTKKKITPKMPNFGLPKFSIIAGVKDFMGGFKRHPNLYSNSCRKTSTFHIHHFCFASEAKIPHCERLDH